MPVLILLDHSIGMVQRKITSDGKDEMLFDFARRIVNTIFEHLRTNNPLEVVQLYLFSTKIEPFSELVRESECIVQALANFCNFTAKAELYNAFEHIKNVINSGSMGNARNLSYDVVVVSRQTVITDPNSFQQLRACLPFPQHCHLHFVCCDYLSPSAQVEARNNFSILLENVSEHKKQQTSTNNGFSSDLTNSSNNNLLLSKTLSTNNIERLDSPGSIVFGSNDVEIIQRLIEVLNKHFVPIPLQLICGTLSGSLSLFPILPKSDASKTRIHIQGFLPSADVSNCITLSKHLIQPIPDSINEVIQKNATVWPKNIVNFELLEKDFENPLSRPHFCALLKKSLIKSKYAAICTVDNSSTTTSISWFPNGTLSDATYTGFILPQQDENSSLQLCIFEKMPDWIDELYSSTLKNNIEILPPKKIDSSRAIILHESIIQTDIAKVFRYARRLPDRKEAVLAEMDKFVKLVKSCYFHGLGITLISILERELSQPDTKTEYLLPIINELKLELGL